MILRLPNTYRSRAIWYFSAAMESARDACAADDHAGRFRAISRAYFEWGEANPQKYIFLFGTPIPGYRFGQEVAPSAQRSFFVLQGVVGDAYRAGKISGDASSLKLPTPLKGQYEAMRKLGMPYAGVVTHLALSVWGTMHGMTSLFLYGYFGGFLGEQVGRFVDVEIETMIRVLGLE